MTSALPIPADDSYDYTPIVAEDVRVGMSLASIAQSMGPVVVVPDGPDEAGDWTYITDSPETGIGLAWIPADPSTQPPQWWARRGIWKRLPKLTDGEIATAPDGSRWINDASTGLVTAFESGTGYSRGDQRTRQQLLNGTEQADPRMVMAPTGYDWAPCVGGDIAVGDWIVGVEPMAGTVAQIQQFVNVGIPVTWFLDSLGQLVGHKGWNAQNPGSSIVMFRRVPKPTPDAKFVAPDGSKWIFTAGSYLCWSRGSRYATGAIFARGDIAGGLTPIT